MSSGLNFPVAEPGTRRRARFSAPGIVFACIAAVVFLLAALWLQEVGARQQLAEPSCTAATHVADDLGEADPYADPRPTSTP